MTSLGEFDVIDHRDVNDLPSANDDGTRVWKRELTLETITGGDLSVPAVEVGITNGGQTEMAKSDPIAVRVVSVLEGQADPTQFRDIHSVVDVDVPQVQQANTKLVVVRGWREWEFLHSRRLG